MIMNYNKPIKRIAIVGTGVIGASWAAQYLARGFDVIATDPAPNAEANLRSYVDEAWEQLEAIGLSPGASRNRLTFTANMKEALSKADLVQENAPERPEFKAKLFADMDEMTPVDSLIASSSSGITPSVMQSKCKHPERVLYWTDRGDPPRGNTVNRCAIDADFTKRPTPEILTTHLMEGIGIALDLKGDRMFVTDLAGSVYTARLNGSEKKPVLAAQGNLTGIAYFEQQ